MKMAFSDVFEVHVFMIIKTINSKTTSERKHTTFCFEHVPVCSNHNITWRIYHKYIHQIL